jgi:hypothetical protein
VSTLSAASETDSDKSIDSENSEDVDALILGGRGISADFRHEAYATLDHSLDEGHAVEDATTNFKTLMLDNNANRDGEIGPLVMDWLMKDIHVESKDAKTVTAEINREIEKKGRLGAFVLRMLLHSDFALVSQVQVSSLNGWRLRTFLILSRLNESICMYRLTRNTSYFIQNINRTSTTSSKRSGNPMRSKRIKLLIGLQQNEREERMSWMRMLRMS